MMTAMCNNCMTSTTHRLIHRDERPVRFRDSEYEYNERWELIQCCGCETMTAHRLTWETPDSPCEEFYPTRIVSQRPKWLERLTQLQVPPGGLFPAVDLHPLLALMRETYSAYDNGLLAMTAMGVRAVIDMTMTKLVGDVGSFNKKLDACEQKGFLSTDQKARLNSVIGAGSATAHRGFTPSSEDAATQLLLMEDVVASAFIHPRLVSDLSAKVPPRP